MEINIKVEGLNQFTEAIALLASAMAHKNGMEKTESVAQELIQAVGIPAPIQQPAQQIPVQQLAPIQQPVQQQVTQYQAPQSAPVQQPIQQQTQVVQSAPQAVPTEVQTYSMEQLAVAATQLVDAGRRQELVNLLTSFGVQALTALPKEQYGNFATQLRSMGAKI